MDFVGEFVDLFGIENALVTLYRIPMDIIISLIIVVVYLKIWGLLLLDHDLNFLIPFYDTPHP